MTIKRKSRHKFFAVSVFAAAVSMGVAFGQAADAEKTTLPANNGSVRQELIIPLVQEVVVDEGKAELGKKLWFDPRLSKSGFISCNSCHNLSMGDQITYQHLSDINGKKVLLIHQQCLTQALTLCSFGMVVQAT